MADPSVIRRFADKTNLDRELVYYPFIRSKRRFGEDTIDWYYGTPSFQWAKRLTNYSELDQILGTAELIIENTTIVRNYILRYKADLISFDMYLDTTENLYFQVIGIEELGRQHFHVIFVQQIVFGGNNVLNIVDSNGNTYSKCTEFGVRDINNQSNDNINIRRNNRRNGEKNPARISSPIKTASSG